MNSSFDTRSFGRIFWKEYRVQRKVWLALLLGSFLIELPFLFFSRATQQGMVGYPFAICGLLTICYAVVSATMLFAGETEEETHRFLQTLPLPKGSLFLGKLSFSFLSLLLFLMLSFVGAFTILLLASPEYVALNWDEAAAGRWNRTTFNFLLFAIAVGFASGLVSSLSLKRVLPAAVAGAMLMLANLTIGQSVFRDRPLSANDPTLTAYLWDYGFDILAFLSLAGISVALMPGWLYDENRLQKLYRWTWLTSHSIPERIVKRRHFIAGVAFGCALFLTYLAPPFGPGLLLHGPILGLLLVGALAISIALTPLNPYLSLALTQTTILLWMGPFVGILFSISACILLTPLKITHALIISLIACMMVAQLMIETLLGLPGRTDTQQVWIFFRTVQIVIIGAEFWLTRQWLASTSLDTPAQSAAKTDRVTRWAAWSWPVSHQPTAKLLHWAALRPTLESRMLGCLIWKEIRSATPFIIATLILCGWSIFVGLTFPGPPGNRGFNPPVYHQFTWVVSVLLCAMIGQGVWGSDQRREVFQFLADRGASPVRIWMAKQIVWFPLVVLIATALIWQLFVFGFWSNELRILYPTFPQSLFYSESTGFQKIFWQILYIVSALVTIYSVSQLISLWVPKRIISIAAAVMMTTFIIMGHTLIFEYRVPMWFTAAPVWLVCLIASYATLNGWLLRQRSWRRIGIQTAWVVMPLLVAGAATREWRIYEIPLVSPPYDREEYERVIASFDPKWTARWEELVNAASQATAKDVNSLQKFNDLASAAAEQIVLYPLRRLHPDWTFLDDTVVRTYVELNVKEPGRFENLSLQEQWRHLKTALILNSYVTRQKTDLQYTALMKLRMQVYDALRKWVQDSRQTPELLTEFLQFRDRVPHWNTTVKNRDTLLWQFYQKRGWLWDQTRKRAESGDLSELAFYTEFPFRDLTGQELIRAGRLLNWKTSLQLSGLYPVSRESDPDGRYDHWVSSTDLVLVGPLESMKDGAVVSQQQFEEYRYQSYVPLLLAYLERDRLQHGEYPGQIIDAIPPDEANGFPTNLSTFRFVPHGFDRPLVISPDVVVPAGQPILWRGKSQTPELMLESPIQLATAIWEPELQNLESRDEILNRIRRNEFLWDTEWRSHNAPTLAANEMKTLMKLLMNPPAKTDRVWYVESGTQQR